LSVLSHYKNPIKSLLPNLTQNATIMPVELRKRAAKVPPSETRPAKKASTPTTKAESKKPAPAKKAAVAASKLKEKVVGSKEPAAAADTEEDKAVATTEKPAAVAKSSKAAGLLTVGETIDLESFGGEVETHDGKKVTLKQLLEESKSGLGKFIRLHPMYIMNT
jgi:peroxiredoxin Q/BCP